MLATLFFLLVACCTLARAQEISYIVYPCELLDSPIAHYEHIVYTFEDRGDIFNEYNVFKHETKYSTLEDCEALTNPIFDAFITQIFEMDWLSDTWQRSNHTTLAIDFTTTDQAFIDTWNIACPCGEDWELGVNREFEVASCPEGTCSTFSAPKYCNMRDGMDGDCYYILMSATQNSYDPGDLVVDKELREAEFWLTGACGSTSEPTTEPTTDPVPSTEPTTDPVPSTDPTSPTTDPSTSTDTSTGVVTDPTHATTTTASSTTSSGAVSEHEVYIEYPCEYSEDPVPHYAYVEYNIEAYDNELGQYLVVRESSKHATLSECVALTNPIFDSLTNQVWVMDERTSDWQRSDQTNLYLVFTAEEQVWVDQMNRACPCGGIWEVGVTRALDVTTCEEGTCQVGDTKSCNMQQAETGECSTILMTARVAEDDYSADDVEVDDELRVVEDWLVGACDAVETTTASVNDSSTGTFMGSFVEYPCAFFEEPIEHYTYVSYDLARSNGEDLNQYNVVQRGRKFYTLEDCVAQTNDMFDAVTTQSWEMNELSEEWQKSTQTSLTMDFVSTDDAFLNMMNIGCPCGSIWEAGVSRSLDLATCPEGSCPVADTKYSNMRDDSVDTCYLIYMSSSLTEWIEDDHAIADELREAQDWLAGACDLPELDSDETTFVPQEDTTVDFIGDYIEYPCEYFETPMEHYSYVEYILERSTTHNQYDVIRRSRKYYTLEECVALTNQQFDAMTDQIWNMNEITSEWQLSNQTNVYLTLTTQDQSWVDQMIRSCPCGGTWEVDVTRSIDITTCPEDTCSLEESKFCNIKNGTTGECDFIYMTQRVSEDEYNSSDVAIDDELRVVENWLVGACDADETTGSDDSSTGTFIGSFVEYPCLLLEEPVEHYTYVSYDIARSNGEDLNQYNVVQRGRKYYTLEDCVAQTNEVFDAVTTESWEMDELSEEWQQSTLTSLFLDFVTTDEAWVSLMNFGCPCDGIWEAGVSRSLDLATCPDGSCAVADIKYFNIKESTDETCYLIYMTDTVSEWDEDDHAITDELRAPENWLAGACDLPELDSDETGYTPQLDTTVEFIADYSEYPCEYRDAPTGHYAYEQYAIDRARNQYDVSMESIKYETEEDCRAGRNQVFDLLLDQVWEMDEMSPDWQRNNFTNVYMTFRTTDQAYVNVMNVACPCGGQFELDVTRSIDLRGCAEGTCDFAVPKYQSVMSQVSDDCSYIYLTEQLEEYDVRDLDVDTELREPDQWLSEICGTVMADSSSSDDTDCRGRMCDDDTAGGIESDSSTDSSTTAGSSDTFVEVIVDMSLPGETVESFDESIQTALIDSFAAALSSSGIDGQCSLSSIGGVPTSRRRLLDDALSVEMSILLESGSSNADLASTVSDIVQSDEFASLLAEELEAAGVELEFTVDGVVRTSTDSTSSDSVGSSTDVSMTDSSYYVPEDSSTATSHADDYHTSIVVYVDASANLEDEDALAQYIVDLADLLDIEASHLEVMSVDVLADDSFMVVIEVSAHTEDEVNEIIDAFASLTADEQEAAQIGSVDSGCTLWGSCGACATDVSCSWCATTANCYDSSDTDQYLCTWVADGEQCEDCASTCVGNFFTSAKCDEYDSCTRGVSAAGVAILGVSAVLTITTVYCFVKKTGCCASAGRKRQRSKDGKGQYGLKEIKRQDSFSVSEFSVSESGSRRGSTFNLMDSDAREDSVSRSASGIDVSGVNSRSSATVDLGDAFGGDSSSTGTDSDSSDGDQQVAL